LIFSEYLEAVLRHLLLILGCLALVACKHPLAIEGEGDIVERLSGERGCTLEEFQASSPRCTDNEVSNDDYIVRYEAVPRPGWRFVGWEGTACDASSAPRFCEYNIAGPWVTFTDNTWPGIGFPATTAVFKRISDGYTFTKVVDTDRAAPGGSGNFESFGLPALGDGDVAFDTDNADGYWAVLTWTDDGLNLVADTNKLIPGSLDTFERVFSPEISGGRVVFGGLVFGDGADPEHWGIYSDLGGGIRTVADMNTIIPDGIGNFTDDLAIEDSFRIRKGVVAFDTFSGSGVYAEIDGALQAIADLNTLEPGGNGEFNEVYLAGIDGDDIAFYGNSSGQAGISHGFYRNSGGHLSELFETDALRAGQFFDFPNDTWSHIELNEDFSQRALYLNVDGSPQLVAEIGDSTPDGSGNFTFFDNLAVSGKELAFVAGVDDVDFNIYMYTNGELSEVISIGDTLDGKTVVDLNMKNGSGLENGVIAFRVVFGDGSSGIYLAGPD
jgi:hypothetical protein